MKILILGTRGIPNRYGGFEYFAEKLAEKLTLFGHEVLVFEPVNQMVSSTMHGKAIKYPIKVSGWLPKNLQRLQYDLKSLLDAKRLYPSLIIRCGYSHAIFLPFFGKTFRKKIVTNVDGLEWKREKWSTLGRTFLKFCEYLSAKFEPNLIADSKVIQNYLQEKYGRQIGYISYGADIPPKASEQYLLKLGLVPYDYLLTVARLEPENGISEIIEASITTKKKIVLVGPTNTSYAKRLLSQYSSNGLVRFLGGIFDENGLNSLRTFCAAYIHGHSVGGTNPALLGAMVSGCIIIAKNNAFNREVLGEQGFFYSNPSVLIDKIETLLKLKAPDREKYRIAVQEIVLQNYQWDWVVSSYLKYS